MLPQPRIRVYPPEFVLLLHWHANAGEGVCLVTPRIDLHGAPLSGSVTLFILDHARAHCRKQSSRRDRHSYQACFVPKA